jgi:hypothetical protein
MEGERTISPGSHYYLLADTLVRQIKDAATAGADIRGPFELCVQDGLGQQWIVHYLLWGRMERGTPVVHTQFVSLEKARWPTK